MMRRWCVATAVAMLMVAASAGAVEKPHKLTKLGVGVYLASEFDAATTYHLLQNCGDGCYEANPLVRPIARNAGIFIGLGASAYGVNYFARKLENDGHRRWATALRVVIIGIHATAGVHALAIDQ